MKKYENDLQIFSKKLRSIMEQKGLVYGKEQKPDPVKLYNLMNPYSKLVIKNSRGFRRSDYANKTGKYRQWLDGRSYPGDVREILELCNALDCDLDYFFTDMEYTTHNVQFIHDKTGLSEKSIRQLGHLNTYPQGKVRIAIIDYFLSNKHFSLALTDIINDYYMTLVGVDNFEKEYLAGYEKEINTAIPWGPVQRRKDAAEAKHFRILKQFDDVIEKLVKHFREKNQQI